MFGLFTKPSEKYFKTVVRNAASNGHRAIEHIAMHDEESAGAITPYLEGVHPQVMGSVVLALVLYTEISISLSIRVSQADTPTQRAFCYEVVEEFHRFVSHDRHFNAVGWERIAQLDDHFQARSKGGLPPSSGWGDAMVEILCETNSVLAQRLLNLEGFRPVVTALDSFILSTYGADLRMIRHWDRWLA